MPPHLLANAHTRTHTLPDVFQRASTSSLVEQVPMQAAALANHLKYARGIAVPPDPVALHELKLFRWSTSSRTAETMSLSGVACFVVFNVLPWATIQEFSISCDFLTAINLSFLKLSISVAVLDHRHRKSIFAVRSAADDRSDIFTTSADRRRVEVVEETVLLAYQGLANSQSHGVRWEPANHSLSPGKRLLIKVAKSEQLCLVVPASSVHNSLWDALRSGNKPEKRFMASNLRLIYRKKRTHFLGGVNSKNWTARKANLSGRGQTHFYAPLS
ncbi:unnamed protein product [Mesocestoides corti]|uniref:Uncharacterized protein n=1 Tax=Mesocestoides corti TaxID=53468 RepID=A0A158QV05_MESCO|nr:unnamed protein product [Mesocestoides corti]